MEKTLQEIAEIVGGEICGDGTIKISGLTNIEHATEKDLTFAVEPHMDEAKICGAAAVLIPANVDNFPKNCIKVDEPKAAFAKLLELFTPKLEIAIGVSDKAFVGKNVKIADGVTVMPFAVVDDNAEIASGAIIYPHVYIGQFATVGEGTVIYSKFTARRLSGLTDSVLPR